MRLPDVTASRCAPLLLCWLDSAAQTMTLERNAGWPLRLAAYAAGRLRSITGRPALPAIFQPLSVRTSFSW